MDLYPLSVLYVWQGFAQVFDHLLAGRIRHSFQHLLGDGKSIGVELTYATKPTRLGWRKAFFIGEDFIGNDNCGTFVLGDNIFFGNIVLTNCQQSSSLEKVGDGFWLLMYLTLIVFEWQGQAVWALKRNPCETKVSNYAVQVVFSTDTDVLKSPSKIKTYCARWVRDLRMLKLGLSQRVYLHVSY